MRLSCCTSRFNVARLHVIQTTAFLLLLLALAPRISLGQAPGLTVTFESPVQSVIFLDDFGARYRGFVALQNGKIYHTIDGGATWSLSQTPPVSAPTPGVHRVFAFKDSLTGWVAVSNSTPSKSCWKTTDGGLSWLELSIQTDKGDGLYYHRAQGRLYFNALPNLTYISDDDGTTWKSSGFLPIQTYGITFSNDTDGVAITSNADPNYRQGSIYTHDGGKTWKRSQLNLKTPQFVCQPLGIAHSRTFFIGAQQDVMRSDDGGNMWRTVHTFTSGIDPFSSVGVVDGSICFLVAQSWLCGSTVPGEISTSTDEGVTWQGLSYQTDYAPSTGTRLHVSPSAIWAPSGSKFGQLQEFRLSRPDKSGHVFDALSLDTNFVTTPCDSVVHLLNFYNRDNEVLTIDSVITSSSDFSSAGITDRVLPPCNAFVHAVKFFPQRECSVPGIITVYYHGENGFSRQLTVRVTGNTTKAPAVAIALRVPQGVIDRDSILVLPLGLSANDGSSVSTNGLTKLDFHVNLPAELLSPVNLVSNVAALACSYDHVTQTGFDLHLDFSGDVSASIDTVLAYLVLRTSVALARECDLVMSTTNEVYSGPHCMTLTGGITSHITFRDACGDPLLRDVIAGQPLQLGNVTPNPATSSVELIVTSPNEQWIEITVSPMLGGILSRQSLHLLPGRQVLTFNVRDYPSGLYAIRFAANGLGGTRITAVRH